MNYNEQRITATCLMSGKLFDSKENGILAHRGQIIQLDLGHVADDVGHRNACRSSPCLVHHVDRSIR